DRESWCGAVRSRRADRAAKAGGNLGQGVGQELAQAVELGEDPPVRGLPLRVGLQEGRDLGADVLRFPPPLARLLLKALLQRLEAPVRARDLLIELLGPGGETRERRLDGLLGRPARRLGL